MPIYGSLPSGGGGTGVPATELNAGDQIALFNAETPAALQASIAIAVQLGAGQPRGVVFTVQAPGSTIAIQGSNQDVASEYQTLHTTTSLGNDFYSDLGGFCYYRALCTAFTSGVVSVIAQR